MISNITVFLWFIILSNFSYLASVTDVLTSVQKTEESLRRLKKIRDKSTGSFSSEAQGISDDEKIRIQLQVDVQAYANMVTFIIKSFIISYHIKFVILIILNIHVYPLYFRLQRWKFQSQTCLTWKNCYTLLKQRSKDNILFFVFHFSNER